LFEKFIDFYKYCNVYILTKYEREKVKKDFLKQLSAFRVHNLLKRDL